MQTDGLGPVCMCVFCLPPTLITDPNARLISTTFCRDFFFIRLFSFFFYRLFFSSFFTLVVLFFFCHFHDEINRARVHGKSSPELFRYESCKILFCFYRQIYGLFFFASDAILRSITCSTRLVQISLVYYGNIPYNFVYF